MWDERIPYSRIGMADANPAERWLLAHYRAKVISTENFKPYGQNVFKERLLSLLRAYDVPLPPDGDPAFTSGTSVLSFRTSGFVRMPMVMPKGSSNGLPFDELAN